MKNIIAISFILLTCTILGYTQYLKKESISAVLQYEVDLSNPPDSIFAISTYDQKLSGGKNLPKGTRFIGMLGKEEKEFTIYFDSIQDINGKKEGINAKSTLKIKESNESSGVSAKIGKTLHQQTKTNVLGAIFHSSSNEIQKLPSNVLPRGSLLKIEVN